jgi:poly-gamma-glutamate synthesis protein (capsule biosynthesis protein)
MPLYLSEAGGIGIIAVGYPPDCIGAAEEKAGVFLWNEMDRIEKRIKEVKKKCRWCIVISHGGEEFTALPNPYTRERYIKYLELGADAVVAHHPHVPENYELFEDGKMIFYSLGNFIFDTDYQRAHSYTDLGVLLKLRFSEEKIDFEAIGMKLDRAAGRLYECELPDIFTNIGESDYAALAPLSARGFLAEEMRKMIYLEPERFRNAGEDEWNEYFFSTEPDGYFEGAHMDLSLIVPFAQTLDEKALEDCKLEGVKKYIEAIL